MGWNMSNDYFTETIQQYGSIELAETDADESSGKDGNAVSLGDLIIQRQPPKSDILSEFITVSSKNQELIPRAKLTHGEAHALQLFSIQIELWLGRKFEPFNVIWRKLGYSLAIDGYARGQVADMYSGSVQAAKQRYKDGMLGRIRRGLDSIGRDAPPE